MEQTFKEYSIFYKQEDKDWTQWGSKWGKSKWYTTPNRAYAAVKESDYCLGLDEVREMKMVERTLTYTDKDIQFEF